MGSISVPTAMLIAGGLSAAGSVASSEIGSSAAKSAGKTQLQASQEAAARLAPFMNAGLGALGPINSLLGISAPAAGSATGTGTGAGAGAPPGGFAGAIASAALHGGLMPNSASGNPLVGSASGAPAAPAASMLDALKQTPGYQFTLQQGLEAAQSGFAAQGLAQSGPAIKGAVNYAEGLAGTTYQQQLENYMNLASMGADAAAGVGNYLTSGAAASAAGTVGAANAITGGISGLTGTTGNTALMLALQKQGWFGTPTGGAGAAAGTTVGNVYGAVSPADWSSFFGGMPTYATG